MGFPRLTDKKSRTRRNRIGEAFSRQPIKFEPNFEVLEERVLLSITEPVLLSSFPGLDFTDTMGFRPPDTHAAAGPNHVVEVVNSNVAIFDQTTGTRQFAQPLITFFGPTGVSELPFDPKVAFDELSQRFIVVALEGNGSIGSVDSHLLFAISDDSNPNGAWEMHRLDVKDTGVTEDFWGDYPGLGWDADGIYVTLNMFGLTSGLFDHVSIISIEKALVLDAQIGTFSSFDVDRDGSNFTLQPAVMHGSAPGDPMYFVSESGFANGGTLRVVRMENKLSDTPTFTETNISVDSYAFPPDADQPGSPPLIQTNDTRVLNAAWRFDRLVASQTVGADGVARARWYEFDTSGATPTLTQSGEINPGDFPDAFPPIYQYPATNPIVVDGNLSEWDPLSIVATRPDFRDHRNPALNTVAPDIQADVYMAYGDDSFLLGWQFSDAVNMTDQQAFEISFAIPDPVTGIKDQGRTFEIYPGLFAGSPDPYIWVVDGPEGQAQFRREEVGNPPPFVGDLPGNPAGTRMSLGRYRDPNFLFDGDLEFNFNADIWTGEWSIPYEVILGAIDPAGGNFTWDRSYDVTLGQQIEVQFNIIDGPQGGVATTNPQGVFKPLPGLDLAVGVTAAGLLPGTDPSQVFSYFPSIEIAPSGALGMTYMRSSASEFMSVYATGRALGDPLGQMQSPLLIKAGEATYTGLFRAGDYSGITVDPVDGTFWVANEYATSQPTPDNWGTWIANIDVVAGDALPQVLDVQVVDLDVIVTFSEPVTNVTGTTFVFERSGLDDTFGDGDEVAFLPVSLTPGTVGPVWTFTVDPTASLLPDTYRVTLLDAIVDTQGEQLDGEFTGKFPSGDGTAGGNFVFAFEVRDRPPRVFLELDDPSDTGVKGDRITNRATPTLEGMILDAFPSLTRNQLLGIRVDVFADFAGALGDADFAINGVSTDDNSEFQFDIPASNPLPEGVHRIEVTFTDLNGNTTVKSRAIRVDLTPPTVTSANIDGLDIFPLGPTPLTGIFSEITVVIDDPPVAGVSLGLDQAEAGLLANYQLIASGNGVFGDGDDLDLSGAITSIDLAFNPLGPGQIGEFEPNDAIASAQNLDGLFSLTFDPNIGDTASNTSTALGHVTIQGTGNGTFDYYSFTIDNAGDRAIFDIDFGFGGAGSIDTELFLYDLAGNLLASNDDFLPASVGEGGSTSSFDAFLEHVFTLPGTYVIGVGEFNAFGSPGGITGNAPDSGDTYTLQVSREGIFGSETEVTLSVNASLLVDDLYQFIVKGTSTVTDTAGNALDGDNDGVPGPDFVREFQLDGTAPRVLDVSPDPRSLFESSAAPNEFVITFTEDLLAVPNGTIHLTRSGSDGVFGNADDVSIPGTVAFTPGRQDQLVFTPDAAFLPLPPDYYRLQISSDPVTLGVPDNVNVSQDPGNFQSEMQVDVNPTDPQNLVAFSHTFPSTFGPFDVIDTYRSLDGGQTWETVSIDNSVDGLGTGSRFDPSVVFDANGNVYLAYGFSDGVTSSLHVARSVDQGATYAVTPVIVSPAANFFEDKWFLAAGPDATDPTQENIYVSWTRFPAVGNGFIAVSGSAASNSGGTLPLSFTAPVTVNDNLTEIVQLSEPAVGVNGELYVAWVNNNGNIEFDVDPDGLVGGLAFGSDITVGSTGGLGVFRTLIPAQPERGIQPMVSIDVDHSGGPFHGRIYASYTDTGALGAPDTNIVTQFADPGSLGTWSPKVIVNDDATSTSQFLGWLDVDPTDGTIVAIWYDARRDLGNGLVDVFMATSTDGGVTFGPNIRVSQGQSDQRGSTPPAQDYLEYIGLAVFGGTANVIWADNSTDADDLEVFFAAVPIPVTQPQSEVQLTDLAGNLLDGEALGFDDGNGGFQVQFNSGERLPGLSGDGLPGGDFVTSFIVAAPENILFAQADYDDDPLLAIDDPDGTLAKPFPTLQRAMGVDPLFVEPNSVASLRAGGATGPIVVWALESVDSTTPFVIASPRNSGIVSSLEVPDFTALVFDPGTITKLQNSNIDVNGAGSVLQVIGSTIRPAIFTSFRDDSIGGDTNGDGILTTPFGGDWGGLVLRDGSDDFLSIINFGQIRYGGGPVPATLGDRFDPIYLETARAAVTNTEISFARSAQAAISANVDSFLEDDLARGLLVRDVTFVDNSINGLWVRPDDLLGFTQATNAVPANSTFTFDDPVPHVLTSVLIVGQRFLLDANPNIGESVLEVVPQRFNFDPGTVFKFTSGAGIEMVSSFSGQNSTLNIGDRQFLDNYDFSTNGGPQLPPALGDTRVILTSLLDDSTQTGSDLDGDGVIDVFYTSASDTNNDGNLSSPTRGSWGGIGIFALSTIVVDEADFRFGGDGNLLTVAKVRRDPLYFRTGAGFSPIFAAVTNSNIESALGPAISVDPQVLHTGDPTNPLVSGNPFFRGNVLVNNGFNALEVDTQLFFLQADPLTGAPGNDYNLSIDSVWDDTDLVHFIRNFSVIARGAGPGQLGVDVDGNDVVVLPGPFFTTEPRPSQVLTLQSMVPGTVLANGERIEGSGESLVVKLLGGAPTGPGDAAVKTDVGAGFQFGFDDGADAPFLIDSGLGSQLRIVGVRGNDFTGQVPMPVIITSLHDDTAGTTVRGVPMFDTAGNGSFTTPQAGDGGAIVFGSLSLTDYDLNDPSRGSIIDTADLRYLSWVHLQGGGLRDMFDLRGDFTTDDYFVSDDQGRLWRVNPGTAGATLVGSMLVGVAEIAFHPDGRLFGITTDESTVPGGLANTLYEINAATAQATVIGPLNLPASLTGRGLDFDGNDTLYLATSADPTLGQSQLFTVDILTGATTFVDNIPFVTQGDIAFAANGIMFMTSDQGAADDGLVMWDPGTGIFTGINAITGQDDIEGLDFAGGELIGITSSGGLISIDLVTAAPTPIATTSPLVIGFGAASRPLATGVLGAPIPDGQIGREDLIDQSNPISDQRRGTGVNSTQAMTITNSIFANMRDFGVRVTPGNRLLARDLTNLSVAGTIGEIVTRTSDIVGVPFEVLLVNNVFHDITTNAATADPIAVHISGDDDTGVTEPPDGTSLTGFGSVSNQEIVDDATLDDNLFIGFVDMRNHSVLLHNTFFNTDTAVIIDDPGGNTRIPSRVLLMNNIFANSEVVAVIHTSPRLNPSAEPLPPFVQGKGQFNLYFNNTLNGFIGQNAVFGDPAFLDEAARDFRLDFGSAAVDASLSEHGPNSNGDFLKPIFVGGLRTTFGRSGLVFTDEIVALPSTTFVPAGMVVPGVFPANASLNIPSNPAFDPTLPVGSILYALLGPTETGGQRDFFGFQRLDEPGQSNIGNGRRPFFDIGAIERADFFGPTIVLTEPLDNGPDDRNPVVTEVLVNAATPTAVFELSFSDVGYGVDDTTINPSAFIVQLDGSLLTDGVDFTFNYNPVSDVAQFISLSGVFPGGVYTITVNNSLTTGVLDRAGNSLVGNNVFTIVIDADPPVAVIRTPEDNGQDDFDPAVDIVVVDAPTSTIVIEITDLVGEVEDDSVALPFTLGVPQVDLDFQVDRGRGVGNEMLVIDDDFSFSYDPVTNEITLTPLSPLGNSFSDGLYTLTLGDGAPGGLKDITDQAGNLLANPTLIVHVREVGALVSDTALTVMEQGPTNDQYSVSLTSRPTSDVTISLTVDDPTQVTLSTTSLVFTSANWFVAQPVIVTAVDDNLLEPAVTVVVISQAATSLDALYDGLAVPDVMVDVIDNDPSATISGVKFNDLDLDGQRGPGEPGLPGWTIFLDQNNNGVRDLGEEFDITDAAGNYSFTITLPDTYIVAEELQPDWIQTAPASGTHVLPITTSVNLTDIDFGNFLTSSISGRKFEDLDLDGLQGPGESGLAGWVIFLDENTNNVLDSGEVSTVTDASGDYTFAGLTLGTFRVVEVNQAGWVQTAPATGLHVIELASSGQNITGRDFGNFQELIAGPEFPVNQVTDDSQLFPSIAMASDGRYVLAWASRSGASDFDIYARQFNADGSPAGDEFRVNSFLPGTQTLPSVAIDNSGNFVVTWTSLNQDGTPRSVYAQRFDSTGSPVGTEFRVNLFAIGFQTNATVGMNGDGAFTIVWTDFSLLSTASDLFAQQFDASGVRQGDPFKVNTFTSVGQGADTDLAMDPDGNFTIVWTSFTQDGSGGGVFTRMFGADGTPNGDEFPVNTFTTGQQTEPAIAMDSGGNFTVVWASSEQDGSGLGIFGRQFNAMGTPLGNEFSINAFTTGDQRDPDVSMDASGGFVVTWTSDQQDGDRDGVFAQRFDAAGNQLSGPLGIESQINITTFNNQNDSTIATDTAGNFVIAWTSFGQDGDAQGIFARQFQLVSPGGSEITVITGNATKIVDDTTTPILFAETMESTPGPMATFLVRNDGIDPLSLGSVGLPTGFLIIDGLPASLAPGAWDSLTIQLDTSLPGSYGGQVVIVNNDGNENPFDFAIAGSVMEEPVREVVGATPGLFSPSSTFFLKNDMEPGVADEIFSFGSAGAGWIPLAGDWNNDQVDTTGVFDPVSSTFYLNNSNATAALPNGIRFGPQGAGWTPIVGDWDGDGVDTIGLYSSAQGTFFLRNSNTPGFADIMFRFGPTNAGFVPLVGDWDGDGFDSTGLFKPSDSSFFLKNSNTAGVGDLSFRYGPLGAGWLPLAGDWSGDGQDTVGLYAPGSSTFFVKNDNSQGVADQIVRFGPAGSGWTPLVGDWDGSAATAQTATAATVSNPFALLGEMLTSGAKSTKSDETIESADTSTSTLASSNLSLTSSQPIVGTDTILSSGANDSVDAALADLDLDPLNDDLLEELAAAFADPELG